MWTRVMLGAVLAVGATPLLAQVVMLNGTSSIGSDSKNGFAVRVVSANSGGARVSIASSPAVALVCDDKTPRTTCYAYVQKGARITFQLRRPTSAAMMPGQGDVPKPSQWAFDCIGTTGPDCAVTMTQPRTVYVDWSAGRAIRGE